MTVNIVESTTRSTETTQKLTRDIEESSGIVQEQMNATRNTEQTQRAQGTQLNKLIIRKY